MLLCGKVLAHREKENVIINFFFCRLKQMETGIADFQLSKTSMHMFLASLEAAKDLQYYPVKSVTTHASRVVRLLEGMETSMTSADFFELRTRLEYITAAKANPFAEMDISDSCP